MGMSYQAQVRLIGDQHEILRICKMARNKKSVRWNANAVRLEDLRRFESLQFSVSVLVDWVQYQDRIESIPCLLETLKTKWTFQQHLDSDKLSELQQGQCCTMDGPVGSNLIFYFYPKGKDRGSSSQSPSGLYGNLLRKPWWIKSFKYHFTVRVVGKDLSVHQTEGEIKTEGNRPLSFSFEKQNLHFVSGWRSFEIMGTITEIKRTNGEYLGMEKEDSSDLSMCY